MVDEPVARIGETNHDDADSVLGREPLRLRVENLDEPSAHRAKADKPDPQRLHTPNLFIAALGHELGEFVERLRPAVPV